MFLKIFASLKKFLLNPDIRLNFPDCPTNKLKSSFLFAIVSPSLLSVLPPSERSLDSVGRSRQESLSSVEEDDYDTLDDINSDKNIVRTKVHLPSPT